MVLGDDIEKLLRRMSVGFGDKDIIGAAHCLYRLAQDSAREHRAGTERIGLVD
jgi:hypothetical protein